MIDMTETFPLIGPRDYIHSTTLLAFLDRRPGQGQPPAVIDLRLKQKVRPGVRVLGDCDMMMPDAAASALIEGRWFNFINSEAPNTPARAPDFASDIIADIRHEDARTIFRPLVFRPEDVWPKLIFAARRHIQYFHLHHLTDQTKRTLLLTRVSCRKPMFKDCAFLMTEVTIDEQWFRLVLRNESDVLGKIYCAILQTEC